MRTTERSFAPVAVALALLFVAAALAPTAMRTLDAPAGSPTPAASAEPGMAAASLAAGAPAAAPASAEAPARTATPKMPVLFEANVGQAPDDALFVAEAPGYTLHLLADGLRMAGALGEDTLRFQGASKAAVAGAEPLPSHTMYFLTDATLQAPHFASVAYRGLYPGVDAVFYVAQDGAVEFDYVAAPGADLSRIRLATDSGSLSVEPDGRLALPGGGYLNPPILYQEADGGPTVHDGLGAREGRVEVAGSFAIGADGAAHFEVGAHDGRLPLVIDPKLGYSSFFGGDANEVFHAAKGYGGHLYAVGTSTSSASTRCAPLATCPSSGLNGVASTVLAKFDLTVDGVTSLVWIARLQGTLTLYDIDVDASGIYLTGSADATLPLTANAYQIRHGSTYAGAANWQYTNCGSAHDAFLARLNLAGSSLLYSSFLGGQMEDWGFGVASRGDGTAAVVGTSYWTNGMPFPTKNGFQMVHNGPPASNVTCFQTGMTRGCLDAFVARFDTNVPTSVTGINPDSLVFSSLAGSGGPAPPNCTISLWSGFPTGTGSDVATDVAYDSMGALWVSGYTNGDASVNPPFPSASGSTAITPFQANPQGGGDGFLLKVLANGTLQYRSFLGGSGMDRAYSLAVASNLVYVVGGTDSSNFPTNGAAFRTTPYAGSGALQDAFVASISTTSGQLIKSTFLGSVGESNGFAPPQCTWSCVAVYIGNDVATAVHVDPQGNVVVQGLTEKGGEGTTGKFPRQRSWPGLAGQELDLFAAKLTPDLGELLFAAAVGSVKDDAPRGSGPSSWSAGFPMSNSWLMPGHHGTLITDADTVPAGTASIVLVGGHSWPNRGDMTSTWFWDDDFGTLLAPYTQNYLVHRYMIRATTPCAPNAPGPWSSWYEPCYNWPADGHLQWNITMATVDPMGNVATFTKEFHLVRCGASWNGGLPLSQFVTPNPGPASWPTPQLRGASSGAFVTQYDDNCINTANSFYQNWDYCCDVHQDHYPTAGGFPIDESAESVLIDIPDLKSFKRTNHGMGTVTYCCSTATANPPDAVLARFIGPSEPYVVCGVTTPPPHYRTVPIGFTWAPAGYPHTQGIETYDSIAANDPNWGMDIASFRWDFDYDGTFNPEPSANGQVTPTYTYPTSTGIGVKTVRVEAQDTNGVLGYGECTLTLVNMPPVAACAIASAPPYVTSGAITFSAAGSNDPDGTVTGYSWDFPGGSPATSTAASPSVTWASAGTYTVTLRVTDNDLDPSNDVTCDLTIMVEIAPVARDDPHGVVPGTLAGYAATEDTLLTVGATVPVGAPFGGCLASSGVLCNDDDNGPLSSLAVLPAGARATASGGIATLAPTGAFTYQGGSNFCGEDTFQYTAHDGYLASNAATAYVDVACTPDLPTAVSDAYVTGSRVNLTALGCGSPVESVRCNDIDPDVPPSPALCQLTSHAVRLVTPPPAPATVSLATDGTFTFYPNGLTGTLTFQYRLDDACFPGSSNVATATVVVSPGPPVARDDEYNVPQDRAYQTWMRRVPGVMGNDADPDIGDSILVDLGAITPPAVGTLDLRADGHFEYVPPAGFLGVTTFTYRVEDTLGYTSLPATVTIRVCPNGLPQADFEPSTTHASVGQDVLFIDRSIDPAPTGPGCPEDQIGCHLWDFGDGSSSTDRNPVHTFTTPGEYRVRLTVCDQWGDMAEAFATIRVGQPPIEALSGPTGMGGMPSVIADAGDDIEVPEGTLVRLQGSAIPANVRYSWTQVGEPAVALADPGTPSPTFLAPLLPDGQPLSLYFQLVAVDGSVRSPPDLVRVTVVSANRPPVAVVEAPQDAVAGTDITLDGAGSHDPDGEDLVYRWTVEAGPAVTLQGADTPRATFVAPDLPPGTLIAFSLEVSDGKVASKDTVLVVVQAGPSPPPATAEPADPAPEGPAGRAEPESGLPWLLVGLLALVALGGAVALVAVLRRRA